MPIPVTVDDYREIAKERLPKTLFDYVDGGSYSETTLRANIEDLQRIRLRQRVMRDVSALDTRTIVLGQVLSTPVILAPVGLAGMMARRGEVQAAKAAERKGVPFTLSTVGICSIAEIRNAVKAPFWFQLYMMKDRGFIREMLARAAEAKCGALVFTVDLAVLGTRYRDIRNGMGQTSWEAVSDYVQHSGWLWDVALRGRPLTFGNLAGVVQGGRSLANLSNWVNDQLDPSVTWKDIAWVRENWRGPLLIKGVLEADDARRAIESGADGVIVSNHGGRQLDCAQSSIASLPAIVEAVGSKSVVLMDGGIRSGQDIAKALALGAKACLIGRPWVFAMAAAGEKGVTRLLTTLQQELRVTMALLGATKIADLNRDLVV